MDNNTKVKFNYKLIIALILIFISIIIPTKAMGWSTIGDVDDWESYQRILTLEDLDSDPGVLCDQHGTALNTGYYDKIGTVGNNPIEKYILAACSAGYNDGEHTGTPVQNAWWMVHNQGGSLTWLYNEAKAYQDYKEKLDKKGGFNPTWKEDCNGDGVINELDEVTVSFNPTENNYIIGPFSIDYIMDLTKCNIDSEGRFFSSITDATLTLKIDGGEQEHKVKDGWDFILLDGNGGKAKGTDYKTGKKDLEYKFPASKQVFYIKVDYKENLTEISKIHFDFKYLEVEGSGTLWRGYRQTSESRVDENDVSYTQKVQAISQRLVADAHGKVNVKEAELEKKFDIRSTTITIEKTTYDDTGTTVVPIDKTFLFKIYLDGKEFQELTITTKNGYGKAVSNRITLSKGTPSYTVEEIGDYKNDGPWTGTVSSGSSVEVKAKNFIEPQKGTLQLDKKLLNPTPALESEVFKFKVTVTGKFSYENGPIQSYSADNPLEIDVTINGAGTWNSGEFKWYGAAPKYKIVENIPENATYELVNGVIASGNGYLQNGKNKIATATNKTTSNWTVLELDKKLVSETAPQPGEVFTANLTITGKFSYDNDAIQERTLNFNIVLDQSNNWKWTSSQILWSEGEVPTYTISEVQMAEGTTFVSLTDETQTSLVNNFNGKLNPEKTLVVLTNDRAKKTSGKIQINKLVETDDLIGKTFNFNVKVTGTFSYLNNQYNDQAIEFQVPVTVDNNGEGSWISDTISWEEGKDSPTYEVSEINLPEGSQFVSISNGEKTITSSQTITGKLNGVVEEIGENNGSAGKVIITCTNTGTPNQNPEYKQAHLVIIKESLDESIDDYVFFFKVTLTGTFRYYNVVNPDGTIGYTQYTNETLVLDGKIDDVEAVCGGEDWVSELIVWDKNDPAPTYTVEEISIPANIDFVSISNRTSTSKSTRIDGTITEGTERNYITGINKPGKEFVDGSIRISKKSSEDLKGKIFYFDLNVKGNFDYAGKHYGSGSENGDTFTLKNIEVEANGNPWVSGVFSWDQAGAEPTYEVKEVNIPAGSHFVSISNEKEICTDSTMTIRGNLSLTKPAKIVAINYGDNEPNGSHIEITKEVLNEKLKGTNFYFNVKVTSDSPFRYHDLEDATKVTEYNAGDVVEFKNVVAVADEKDWVSGYFEWDEGASRPTYEISEITSAFPDKVKSVSLRNDTNIIVKELTNKSGEDLTITGSLAGDITHIIAVNDCDEEAPVQGKIVIEKQALSEIIDGEEFVYTLSLSGKFKYNGQDYRKLDVKDIRITANGPKWESGVIEWYEKDGAPVYTVTEEVATFLDGTKFVSIRNAYQSNTEPAITGTVEPHFNNWVIAENTFAGYEKGRLQIHKVLLDEKGNQIDGVDFTFKVSVNFKGTNGESTGTQEEEVTVTSGGYWRSDWYTWSKRDGAPTYTVQELNNDGYSCTIDNSSGELVAQNTEEGVSGIVTVNAQNKYQEEHQAKIRVNKELVLNDKMSKDDVSVSFNAIVKVTGNFTYKGKAYVNDTLTLRINLTKGSNWTWLSDTIKWNGDEAPYFVVEEPEADMPVGWHLVSTQSSSANNQLSSGGTAVVDIKNEWTYQEGIVLTMKLAGKVWDDTNRKIDKHVDSLENGIIDDDEPGIPNVKVTISRAIVDGSGHVTQKLDGVYVYDENNLQTRIDGVTYTDNDGYWSFGAVSVPALTESEKGAYEGSVVTYVVEYEYDGQTYEPTVFLASAGGSSDNMYGDISGRSDAYINSSTAERDKFLFDSMAVEKEEERTSFNNSFGEIQGKDPIDGDGNTVGKTGSGKELNYTSVDTVSFFNSDNSRKISTLKTVDENNEVYEDLLMKASTENANLSFPIYKEDPSHDVTAWHLKSWDKSIKDMFKVTYKFEAVYNYCLNINLGLVEREAADIATEKDLTEAVVVVNGKALKYKFNNSIDFEDPNNKELLYKQLAVADAQIEYKLGLYKGDYYYRASVYDGTQTGNALQGFYTTRLGLPVDTSEMEIYLKYTINVYNQSETYDVTIGELADYYDSTFKLMDSSETRYVQTLNGKTVESVIDVGGASTLSYSGADGAENGGSGNISWSDAGSFDGSDGVKYSKITTSSLAGKKLATGEKATITVTFKVDKDAVGDSGVLNTIKLGKKHNVAEVTKFTSYYSDKSNSRWGTAGQIAGRVDCDSAPGNVNIQYYNDKSYYEDDTDSAPIITIGIKEDEIRAVSGIVWDDAQTANAQQGQIVGDGLFDPNQGDKLVNNLTTEIYEAISIPETTDNGETVYREYQFAWPTETPIPALGNHTIAELTGFHQSTVTANGGYEFINLPAGNYKVRFIYGDKAVETGRKGSEEVYSGQDYKTTAYQIGFNNDKDNDGYVDNEWHDISNNQLSDLRVNDARDDEARRLYISAKSEMLTYDNSSKLITADDKNANHNELFGNYSEVRDNPVTGEGYYMYAETAKINLGVENIYKIGYTTETIGGLAVGAIYGDSTQNGKAVGTQDFTYNIRNVDCGLEERSQTKLTLDKQIKQITLMTSDNKVILDAVYDINYTMKSDGSISSTVTLNKEASTGIDHIASLNRRGSYDQGYRYIITEGSILQGAQIQVKYQLTVFNMSETDRISKDLESLWQVINTADSQASREATLHAAMDKVSSSLYTESKGRVYNDGTGFKSAGYGTYFGSIYYLGTQGVGVRADQTIVKTKVHQMLDYIDPDVEFTDMNNMGRDGSWANTEIAYLLENKLIDPSVVQILDNQGNPTGDTAASRTLNSGERYSIISDKLQEYRTDVKNNLVLSIDSEAASENGTNPGFAKFLEPYMANSNVEKSTGTIGLYVSRFYSSESDGEDIDNLAELVKIENTAGRRDSRNVTGNANPYNVDGIYAAAQGKEKDASATEVITLSPPTGLNADESRTMQLILVIVIAVTLVAVSIVIIKKKVLIKK